MAVGRIGAGFPSLAGRTGLSTVQFLNTSFISVTSGVNGAAYGSYAEITASTAAEYYILGLLPETTPGGIGLYRVAVGAAASEVVVAEQAYANQSVVGLTWAMPFWIPPRVAAGSRIAVAYRGPTTTANGVILLVAPVANLEGH